MRRLMLILLMAFLFGFHLSGSARTSAADGMPPFGENVQYRGSLDNSRIQMAIKKKMNVAFMGGSITEMNGYRPMVCEILKKRFPETEFQFTDAGISSTCSTSGAFRLERDVLSHGAVDLFFVEFAVNDDQDAAHARRECIRGLEGIVQHCRRHNPHADIVVTFFVNEGMLKSLQAGQTPLTIEAHETVAKHYGISTINLAKEVAQQISADKLTWQKYGGVHPAPFGNAICAAMIDELFARAWAKPLAADAQTQPHAPPARPLDELSYSRGRFLPPTSAVAKSGWNVETPNWNQLPGGKRPRFTSIPMFSASTAGAEASLEFEGTAVGAFIVAGPDAGILEASVDGGPFQAVDTFHRYSKGLHYPRTVMLATDLKPGKHVVTFRIAEKTNSSGHAVRIMQFAVN